MKTSGRIFLLDDDELIITMLARGLRSAGHETRTMTRSEGALAAIESWHPDIVLLDIHLGEGPSGLDILARIKEDGIPTEVVMLTGDDTVESAISSMKLGAADYLTKPFNVEEVKIVLEHILEKARLKDEVEYLRRDRSSRYQAGMIGETPAVRKLREKTRTLAESKVESVLITGESGTGKEVLARAFHEWKHGMASGESAPFVAVNCTALPGQLIESELFGHVKGAFTDAKTDKKGMFELAHGGSILLDEIGDMELGLQAKFLRVLEERQVRRVGGKVDLNVELTVIATTNRDLKLAVAKGDFRPDLYYRLSTFALHIPPLRERKEDILLLAEHFLATFAKKYRKRRVRGFSAEAQALLAAYGWPGNVRELKNVIERVVVLEDTGTIGPEHLPAELAGQPSAERKEAQTQRLVLTETGLSLEEVEKDLIDQALALAGNNQTKAAKLLDISYDSLRYQAKKYGLL